MKKLAALLILLILLPLAALANDYAWTASHLIREDYPEDCTVTIVMHGTEKGFRLGFPRLGWSYADFTSTYGDFILVDEFQVSSLATGASQPLDKAVRATYGVTLTGADAAHLAGIRDMAFASRTLKVDIPSGTLLTGPGEDSPHNSRSYFVRIYGQQQTLTCTASPWFSAREQRLEVMQVEPLVWVLYAVDTTIPPLEEAP